MRSRLRQMASVASLPSLLACSGPAASVEEIVVNEVDSAGVRVVSISGSIDALPEWRLSETPLIEIRGDAPPFLGRVGEVAFLGEQQVLVQDRQTAELHLFGLNGQASQVLARAGDGPGELRLITQLSSTGDTAYAFDSRHNHIAVFAPSGDFLTTIPVQADFAGEGTLVRKAWALDSDRLLLFGYGLDDEENGRGTGPRRVVRDAIIQVLSRAGTERASPIRFPGETLITYPGGTHASPFWNRPIVAANLSKIVHGSGFTYELVLRDLDLRPVTVIRWLGSAQALSPATLRALREPLDESLHELRAAAPDAADRVIDAVFNPDVLPDALPALGSALLDESGRLWVSRFRPPDDMPLVMAGGYEQWHQEDVWHVLDPEGTPVARLRLPSETRLLAVRSDRVAVVTRDELEVEHVRVLAINQVGAAR